MVERKVGRPKGSINKASSTIGTAEDKRKIEELERKLLMLETTQKSGENKFEEVDIRPDEYIKVISLFPSTLILNTRADGSGKRFTFKEVFEDKRILYGDLVEVMEAHSEHTDFLREGYYYIADNRVVRRHGLDDVYNTLLTEEQMKSIIDGSQKDALAIFESAGTSQKSFICNIMIAKLANGEEIDLNVIDQLSRMSGVSIQEKANEAKQYAEMSTG